MKPIKWKDGCESLYQSLGITQDRADELDFRLRSVIHEVQRPVKKGQESPGSDTFIKMCIALAETEEERIFCAYVAGGQVPRLYDEDEFEEYEDEDDHFPH